MLTKDNNRKESFDIVDICKFLLCICVIALHSNALGFLPKNVQYFIEKLIFRVAVPYFFIASGFFLGRKLKTGGCTYWQIIKNYCKRLLKPFIVFSIINIIQYIIPFIVAGVNFGQAILDIIQHIIFYPYGALWYIQASLIGVLLLYPFVKKNKISSAIIIGLVLYAFALLCNNYYFIVKDTVMGDCINSYLSLCISGRNGLFVGFLFIALGIACEKIYSKFKIIKSKLLCCFIISFVLYIIEIILIWKFAIDFVKDDGALYITHLIFIPILFLISVIFSKNTTVKKSVVFRNLSTGMYFLHRPVLWCVSVFSALLLRLFNSSFIQYLALFLKQGFVIFIISLCVSAGICLIAYKYKKEPFYSLLK